MIAQVFRFAMIGLLSTFLHAGVAIAVEASAGMPPLWANFIGFSVAVLVSYLGHTHVTLRIRPDHGAHFPRFLASSLAGLVCSSFETWLVADRLGYPFWAAMLCVVLTVPPLTFMLLKLWVFRPAKGDQASMAIGLSLSAGAVAVFLSYFWGRILNHDIAWYLIATRDWLEGARLYVDIVEVNPPLNFYYTVPAVILADLAGLSPTNAQYLLFGALMFVSLSWSWAVVRRSGHLTLPRQVLFQAALAFALIVPPLGNVVQREHLFVAFVLPWLLGQLLEPEVRRSGEIGRAVFAAMGICLKPYFLLLPIFVTLWQCWRSRSLWPCLSTGNLTIAGVGLGYVLAVKLLHPEYLEQIVPMALEVYGAYGGSAQKVLGRFAPIPTAMIALTFLLALWPRRGATVPGLFWAAALAGLGSYFWQGTGFQYHLIPFFSLISVGLGWFLVTAPMRGPVVWFSTMTLVLIGFANLAHGPYRSTVVETLQPHLQGRKSLAMLTSHVYTGPPVALALDARWSSGYSSLWLVPGVVNGLTTTDCSVSPGRCARWRQIADRQRADVIRDLERGKPEAIVVDNKSGYFLAPSFDWLAFMGQDPRFGPILRGYSLVERLDRFDIWLRSEP